MPVSSFVSSLEALLKTGNATEHTYRPALTQLFNAVLQGTEAINEPKHTQYGAPDFVIQRGSAPIGHVEAKDIDVQLAQVVVDSDKAEPKTVNSKQLKRYRAALPNLLYTNGLEWHWFVAGQPRLTLPTSIGTWNQKTRQLKVSTSATNDLIGLLQQFAAQKAQIVTTPRDLAQRLAQIARWLDEVISNIFATEAVTGSLHEQLKAFRDTLLPNLKPEEFADMYAQTLVYGLFAARVAQPENQQFSRLTAWSLIPKTNPFLRRMFHEVTAQDLDPRIAWLVDDCARLLAHTDMAAVMADFGKATRQEDPVVHFYETFLAAYDPRLRETRGVYYTPEPAVSYLVRSVDRLLQTRFNKPLGLADPQTVVLDPAAGTGTFLHKVVQHIQANLADQGLAGTWNDYVPHSLLPRLFGFELLMAPYTVAHLKLGLLLKELGYTFAGNERLGVYLTNTLADLPRGQQAFVFAQAIAEEGRQANQVKQREQVMVVLGNPPYSKSSLNQGDWIEALMEEYKKTVRSQETQIQALSDDYVKFIRFAHWRIQQTNQGIIALITNNGYLDGPLFRDMRASLQSDFQEIYILNLHGDTRKGEHVPDSAVDQNIFDIQQGVAIMMLVRRSNHRAACSVKYTDVWGSREQKYQYLAHHDVSSTTWTAIEPNSPHFLFIPVSQHNQQEYNEMYHLYDIFGTGDRSIDDHHRYGAGFVTQQDRFAISYSPDELAQNVAHFLSPDTREDELWEQYSFCSTAQWSYARAKAELQDIDLSASIRRCVYRPFDYRYTMFNRHVCTILRTRIMQHFDQPNMALLTTRRMTRVPYSNIFAADTYPEYKVASHDRNTMVFPLYHYPPAATSRQTSLLDPDAGTAPGGRQPNLSPTLIAEINRRLGWTFVPDGQGDMQQTWGPEDLFHYAYAILHSPTYRTRYAEFLKIDFPRLPLTSDQQLFAALATMGARLVDLHLLRLPGGAGVGGAGGAAILGSPGAHGVSYPFAGTNVVENIAYHGPRDQTPGSITINATQRFVGIDPATWQMRIGGYQPLEKWLKDRKGRTLTTADVQHYLRMVLALRETRRIMAEIDDLIPMWPLP